MNTYILFLNGFFENITEVEKFSNNFIGISEFIESPKFIIESPYNLIIVFNSELDELDISDKFKRNMGSENLKFYFLFNREDLVFGNIPKELSDMIFKDLPKDSSLEITVYNLDEEQENDPNKDNEINNNSENSELYVDALLDKIDKFGLKSLTEREKNFLDSFKK